MGRYGKPRKLNAVSLLVVIAVAGAVYAGAKLGPPYLRYVKARGILQDSLARFYAKRQLKGASETEFLEGLRRDAVAKLRALGIVDPKLVVAFGRRPGELMVRVRYRERFRHPIIDKVTTLSFGTVLTTRASAD